MMTDCTLEFGDGSFSRRMQSVMSSLVQQNKTNHGCPGAASSSEVEQGEDVAFMYFYTHHILFMQCLCVLYKKNSLWIRKVLF